MTFRNLSLLTLFLFSVFVATSQDHTRFSEEVAALSNALAEKDYDDPIVFAGSSSIRFWDTDKSFPDHKIINHGFGGSETSDLACFAKELIFDAEPSSIFIYEGDNDLNSGKTVGLVMADMKTLLRIIRRNLPNTPVHFISPKPSIARWNLREKYIALNAELKALCESKDNVAFIDVWSPMLDSEGNLKPNLFVEDGLHMNDAGYDIWSAAVLPHLN